MNISEQDLLELISEARSLYNLRLQERLSMFNDPDQREVMARGYPTVAKMIKVYENARSNN